MVALLMAVSLLGAEPIAPAVPHLRYERERITFTSEWLEDEETGRVTARWSEARRGAPPQPLEGARFYELVGRPDLARAWRIRRGAKLGLLLGGAAAALAGGGVAIYGLSRCTGINLSEGVCTTRDSRMTTAGLIVVGGGALLMVASTLIDAHPIGAAEARRLAEAFNADLREGLGLGAGEVTLRLSF